MNSAISNLYTSIPPPLFSKREKWSVLKYDISSPFSNRLREKLIHLMLLVPRDLRGCMEWMYPNSSSSKNIHPLYLYLNCVIVYIQGTTNSWCPAQCTGQQKTEINGCAEGGAALRNNIWRYLDTISKRLLGEQYLTIFRPISRTAYSGSGRLFGIFEAT